MENASKALLVAGAILLAILLISIAVMTLGQASGLVDSMDNVHMTQESALSNSKFSQCFGVDRTGAEAIALLSLAIVHNSQSGEPVMIETNWYNPGKHYQTSNELQELIDKIDRKKKYTIVLTEGCSKYPNEGFKRNGFIGCISINRQ